jgi:hypothetical protein
MKFSCSFINPDTDERKSIPVALTAQEVKSVEAVRAVGKDADLYAQALALRHSYREVPMGFLHTQAPELQQAS